MRTELNAYSSQPPYQGGAVADATSRKILNDLKRLEDEGVFFSYITSYFGYRYRYYVQKEMFEEADKLFKTLGSRYCFPPTIIHSGVSECIEILNSAKK